MELNYATKGVANAGLATGIVGTTLGALNMLGNGGGILGGLGGGRTADAMAGMAAGAAGAGLMNGGIGRCSENTPVTRYDLEWVQKLMEKDQALAILKSEQNTEVKIADVYERIMTRVNADRRDQDAWNAQQMVNNAQVSAAVAANATSIAALQNCCSQITKLVVPNSAICPGWGPVTVAPQATGTVVG